jgi:hypothetical protein
MRWARDGDGATVRGARSRPSAQSGGGARMVRKVVVLGGGFSGVLR